MEYTFYYVFRTLQFRANRLDGITLLASSDFKHLISFLLNNVQNRWNDDSSRELTLKLKKKEYMARAVVLPRTRMVLISPLRKKKKEEYIQLIDDLLQ